MDHTMPEPEESEIETIEIVAKRYVDCIKFITYKVESLTEDQKKLSFHDYLCSLPKEEVAEYYYNVNATFNWCDMLDITLEHVMRYHNKNRIEIINPEILQ